MQVIHAIYFNSGQKTHAIWQAVLLEQFFMDNKKDLAYLISDEGKRNLIDVIVSVFEAFCSLSFPFHEH